MKAQLKFKPEFIIIYSDTIFYGMSYILTYTYVCIIRTSRRTTKGQLKTNWPSLFVKGTFKNNVWYFTFYDVHSYNKVTHTNCTN